MSELNLNQIALDIQFNAAVLTMSSKLFPGGFLVGPDCPHSYEELVARLDAGKMMYVYDGASDRTIYGCPEVNYAFRAWHDWCHWKGRHHFSYTGEVAVYHMQCGHLDKIYGESARTEHWKRILKAEIVGQLEYLLEYGQFPEDQRSFVENYLALESHRPGVLLASAKDQLLAHLAFEMLVSGRQSLRVSNAIEIVRSKIEQLRKQRQLRHDISAELCLEELIYSGLVTRRDQYINLLHLTILEYFALCEMNREHNFVAQSNMDQHFLRDPEKIRRLIEAADIRSDDVVLEIGAGIGSIARHLPTVRQLVLVDLDRELARILRCQFPNSTVIQADAVQSLPRIECDVIFSNLPFFLSDDIIKELCVKKFRVALMSVKLDFDYDGYLQHRDIQDVLIMDEDDFFPQQPFKSKVIKIRPRTFGEG
jgi:Ribosomal RNA adenine dimethylase